MQLEPITGKYVLGVSGGVDSTVLLDLLSKQVKISQLQLIIAHFDHGIRPASVDDCRFVKELANFYWLPFYSAKGHLGPSASEQTARQARYKFLNEVKSKERAKGIITAHHQDDLIETAIINIIRGTGRKGLSSLYSKTILRPLLKYPKSDLRNYALSHHLSWREDITNQDPKYLRNYIRLNIIPKLNRSGRQQLLDLINKQADLNLKIDKQLASILNLRAGDNRLERLWFSSLDQSLSKEILAAWLRQNGLYGFDKKAIERLSSHLKVISPNRQVDVLSGWQVRVSRDNLALEHDER